MMEREAKEGARATHASHSISLTAVIIIGLVVLLAGYILLAPRETITYYDAIAGRHRTVTKLGYIKIGDEVKDTYFTTLYKKYISPELPSPDWWWSGSRTTSWRGTGFDCTSQGEELAWAAHIPALYESGPLFADDNAWGAFTRVFASIYAGTDSHQAKNRMASALRERLMFLQSSNNRPLRADDLPSLADIRREVEKSAR